MAQDASHILANRYASSLFSLAEAAGVAERVLQDLQGLNQASSEVPELANLMRSPVITPGNKEKALNALLTKAKAAPLSQRFVAVLAQNRRLPLLSAILLAYEEKLRVARGETLVDVASAMPLDKAQAQSVQTQLEKSLNRRIVVRFHVNPDILGGLTIKIGDTVVDASVAGRLDRLGQTLQKAA